MQAHLHPGLTPRRTLENITIGKVDDPGPETKLAITKSSNDKVKANNQPDTNAGAIAGRVISKNTQIDDAPRSCAASSIDSSIFDNLDWDDDGDKCHAKSRMSNNNGNDTTPRRPTK